jgi:iron(III) transport system substrate-binding protein
LANRLIAERNQPQCDVFWGNEELRTRQLIREGVLASNDWSAFGFRSRRIVINTNLVATGEYPRSLTDLTNAAWRGKVALGYPLFGTTATHFAALRQLWGPAVWEQWCRGLVANAALVVDGNSVTVRLVAKGEAAIGLTDSDDIIAKQREGAPIIALPIDPYTLLIPNTAAMTVNAPHGEAGRRLVAYLRSEAVLARLRAAGALEGIHPSEAASPGLQPDWHRLLDELPAATERLKGIFLR